MWPILWDWVENNVSFFSAIEKKFIASSSALQAKKHVMWRIRFIYDIVPKPDITGESKRTCPGKRLSAQ
jgi:hypothetical protein